MIYRVVRLHLRSDATEQFEAFFHERKPLIEAFEGCYRTDLLRDTKEPDVYYTLSEWESEAHLDQYRFSAFFKETWTFTKSLFAGKAQAFSGAPVVPKH
ncbi:MAG: antibiotic biosynthesis monooxygenase [Sphingobacteriales bacterium]|nr:MAG: antibiotic biosynthesis monooxygenase [Sphingobacteriales bacterium]